MENLLALTLAEETPERHEGKALVPLAMAGAGRA